jgi:hypothetical protein
MSLGGTSEAHPARSLLRGDLTHTYDPNPRRPQENNGDI